jgi:Spy/CpxP family protein refolding chaperone
MNSVRKNSWLVRGAAVAIFVLGFAAGALAPSAYRAWMRDRPQGRQEGRIEAMAEQLKLSAEQKTQVQQIFGETRTQLEALRKESEPRFKEIRRQADERLQKVLTPEQWEEFRRSREENPRRGRRGKSRDGGPPPSSDR